MSRSGSGDQDRFAGDELHFTGYDLGWGRDGRALGNASFENVVYGEEDRYLNEHERYYYEEQSRLASRRHGDLLQSANEKLRKAKEKGKTTLNLTPYEMEALQRAQAPQPREQTPPKTPSKGRSSRSSSSASQTGKKLNNKKGSSSRLFSNPSPSASRIRTPRKDSRKSSESEQISNPPPPPAFMIAGPDGVPFYAPAGYYPPSPERIRPGSSRSPADSRSASSSSRREITPPIEPAYPPYPTRYYGDLRPGAPLSRSPHEDVLRNPRNRSASNAQYAPEYFGMPPMPAAQGRRNVSGPADVSYSKAPRMQARSPLATRHDSDPVAQQWPSRTDSRSGASPQASSSSSDDGDEGVRVEILPESQGGYSIDRRPIGSGSGEVKQRKGRK